jgi:FkbM family methyltransferase
MPPNEKTAFNRIAQTRHGPMLYNKNDRFVGASLAAYGEYSEGEAMIFRQIVKTGDVLVEAGANIGAHTIELSRLVGESGVVFAFEPQRIVFQTLCANLALAQCVNVIARQQGLAAVHGELLAPSPDPRQENNFGGLSMGTESGGEKVEVSTLDELKLARCRFIKADVEGMEADVVQGARETIARCRPVLYLENDRAEKSAALLELVLSMNYRIWWHTPRLFNPNNFAGNSTDHFGGVVSINVLCLPAEQPVSVTGLTEISGPADDWRRALGGTAEIRK